MSSLLVRKECAESFISFSNKSDLTHFEMPWLASHSEKAAHSSCIFLRKMALKGQSPKELGMELLGPNVTAKSDLFRIPHFDTTVIQLQSLLY